MQPLRDIRDYSLVLEEEQKNVGVPNTDAVVVQRLAVRERVLAHRSIHANTGGTKVKIAKDYIFECIRLTSLVLGHLSDTCLPIRAAFALTTTASLRGIISVKEKTLKPIPVRSPTDLSPRTASLITLPAPSHLISHLAYAFQKGPNPVVGWGTAMEGVLYWITTVGTAVARGRSEYRLFSSLNAKTLFDMACSSDGRTWDEGFVPIQAFIKFQQLCLEAKIMRLVEIQGG